MRGKGWQGHVRQAAVLVAAMLPLGALNSADAISFDLQFTGGRPVSGTGNCALTLNSRCRFNNVVVGAGTGSGNPYQRDVVVTVTKLTNATLTDVFDNETPALASSPVPESSAAQFFAPTVLPTQNARNLTSWAEFTFDFVLPGTAAPAVGAGTATLPGSFWVTSYDTDGDGNTLREFVEFIGIPSGDTDLSSNTALSMGTAVNGGVQYQGPTPAQGSISTSDPYKASGIYSNVASFKLVYGARTGANGSTAGGRLTVFDFFKPDAVVLRPSVDGYKSVKLTTDANGDGVVSTGDTLTYTVTYTNTGNAPVSNFQIADKLPAGLTLAGAISFTGASRNAGYNGSTNTNLLAANQTLSVDGAVTVNIPVIVGAVADNTTVLNQATSSIGGTDINTDNVDSTTVFPLSIGKTGLSVPSGSLPQAQTAAVDKTSVTVRRSPQLTLNKTVVTRALSSDQFTVQIKSGAVVIGAASTTGTGTSATTNAVTLTSNTTYTLTEIGAAGANLANYSSTLACTNATTGSATVLPSGAGQSFTLTPRFNDDITCTLTNTAKYAISGRVYEDFNYGGGAGRAYAAAQGMSLRPGVRVELYSASGTYIAAALTDAGGAYSFEGQLPGTYRVRVVNNFVTSSRAGACAVAANVSTPPANCAQLPVQTFINGSAAQVGGANPGGTDPALSTTTLPTGAQSVTSVTLGTANLSGVDFGFNFSTVVNTRDAGQGSLRQFMVDTNALDNTGLAQSGRRGAVVTGAGEALPAARDTSIFMIPSAALTGGVAVISPGSSVLPPLTRANVSIDGTTQTINVGNANTGVLGTGGAVGYINTATLDTVQKPEVQLVGTNALLVGLDLQANDLQVRGMSVYGFGNQANQNNHANIRIGNNFTGSLIEANILGSLAGSFDCGASTTVALSVADNIRSVGGDGGTVRNNLIGCAAGKGFGVESGSENWTITNNEIRGNGIGNTNLDGIDLESAGSRNHTVSGNLITENSGVGVDGYQGSGGNTIERNTITGNGIGQGGVPSETSGIRIYSSNNVVRNNVIAQNYGAGVLVVSGSNGNLISQNSIYDNGTVTAANGAAASNQIGIDLGAAGDSAGTGTSPYVTRNDSGDADTGGNGLLNFPVFEKAQVIGGNLQLTGFARPGSTIELFIAAADASGFGEGKTYLLTLTEGSAADTDPGTGMYNDANVGSDTTNRFSFSFPLPSGVVVGTPLTATATCSAGACPGTTVSASSETSEFSYNIAVKAQPPAITLLKLGRNTAGGAFTDSSAIIGVRPGESVEYCVVYSNAGGEATNFVLRDYVPFGMVAQLSAYGASGSKSLGLKYAPGVTLAAGAVNSAAVTPTLTSDSGDDAGSLSSAPATNPGDPVGSAQRPGLMTLNLATVAANSKGTVCFQARVP